MLQDAEPYNAIARLAYADGKIFYLQSDTGSNLRQLKYAQLIQADVTVAIDCARVMPIFAQSFAEWKVDKAQLATATDASPGVSQIVYLQEGTAQAARLPWVFKAYRKVIQVNDVTVRMLHR